MEKTDEQLASLIEKLQEAGFAQAPEVLDGAIRMIYLNGLQQLTFSGMFFVVLFISVRFLVKGFMSRDHEKLTFGGVGTFVSLMLLIIFTAGNPLAKVFDPEAVLYYKILKTIVG